ncbi:MAG: EAL domain-containing protein, partial [Ruminococcus sp.]|nr:EAL domain-containing protein [Ruminococcus sp.]
MDFSEESVLEAIENDELQAFYQPQYNAITAKLKSAEALVRWIKKDGTIIPPFKFIPQAEETDLILAIDWHVAKKVCMMLTKQNKKYPVSVNFSRRHISEENFVEKLSALVDSYELPH